MADSSTPSPHQQEQQQERHGPAALAAILIGVSLGALDTAIANTALPAIAADLHAQPAASIWVVNAYQLAVVATMLPCAALGDLLSPRKVFLRALANFTAASVLCELAHTLALLAAARVLQGVGAAGVMSVNIALIQQIFPPTRLGRGVGMNALVVGMAFALGPTVTSLLLAVGSWHWPLPCPRCRAHRIAATALTASPPC